MNKVLLCVPAPSRVADASDACANAIDTLGGVPPLPGFTQAHSELLADLSALYARLKAADSGPSQ